MNEQLRQDIMGVIEQDMNGMAHLLAQASRTDPLRLARAINTCIEQLYRRRAFFEVASITDHLTMPFCTCMGPTCLFHNNTRNLRDFERVARYTGIDLLAMEMIVQVMIPQGGRQVAQALTTIARRLQEVQIDLLLTHLHTITLLTHYGICVPIPTD